ncbi:hypothetical protein IWQ56_001082 [Coemansia nantahalensis]|uniref:Uncharacterized protein n=1 Tax=Coemansia nantahalensis TaxID=2789366 RepID=A0ACC1K2Z1_9FUNG|nr:hypothetical protein IWQ57_001711 [Coemansia nantahalensis]KAJ2773201.1 hypothetical protein IWQ56_001082 [Coemansia nantahalensis]
MSRPVLSLRLPAETLTRLLRAGFRTVADAEACLAPPPELRLSAQPPPARSAAELARVLRTQPHIATGLPALDALLGARGLPTGAVTELVAHPAVVAALCLRLCLAAAQLPAADASAVYIDTTGSFSAGAARALARRASAAMLERVRTFRVYAAHELVALLSAFDRVLDDLPGARLLVVNSVSWPFLASFPDDVLRRQAMHAEVACLLAGIASRHQIAVVVVSQPKAQATHDPAALPQPMDGRVWAQIAAVSLAVRPHTAAAEAGSAIAVTMTASSLYPGGEALVSVA